MVRYGIVSVKGVRWCWGVVRGGVLRKVECGGGVAEGGGGLSPG